MNVGNVIAAIAVALILLALYKVGGAVESARWLQRENALQAEAAGKLKAAEDRVIEGERAHATEIARIAKGYQDDLINQSDAAERIIADLRAHNVRLSVPTTGPRCGDTTTTTTTGTGSGDAEARTQLSDAAAGFLIGEAKRADAVVLQLAACQAIVTEDRIAR